MTAVIKQCVQYFGDVDVDAFSRAVAEDATRAAEAALRRRRPDLQARAKKNVELPADEQAQFELDRLAFVVSVAERLMDDANGIVFNARRHGASWARIGAAINQSAQTAFNRYRKLDGSASATRSLPERRRRLSKSG